VDSIDDFSDMMFVSPIGRALPTAAWHSPRAENCRLADAVQARDGIIEVDGGVVGQELLVVSAVGEDKATSMSGADLTF